MAKKKVGFGCAFCNEKTVLEEGKVRGYLSILGDDKGRFCKHVHVSGASKGVDKFIIDKWTKKK